MALLFCDGFEKMTKDEFTTRWSSCSDLIQADTGIETSIVRSGDQCWRLRENPSVNIFKNFPLSLPTVVVGFAVYFATDTDDHSGFVLGNMNGPQTTTIVENDGSITVRRGNTSGTILSTDGIGSVVSDMWTYIEMKFTFDNSAGAFEVRVDGSPVCSGESVDTLNNSTPASASRLGLYGNYAKMYFDDVYILDTSGSENNDFLGPQRVDTLIPTAAGDNTNFNPLSGENWACVTGFPDDDATYVTTMSGEIMDTYAFGDLSALSVDNIAGVQVFARARRTAETAEQLDTVCRIGTTDYSGEANYLPIGYYYFTQMWELNPGDSAQWEEADVNGAEFGIKKIDD